MLELLIVIIILGVLASVAVPQFLGGTEDAEDATLRQQLRDLNTAMEVYKHQHGGRLPGTVSAATGLAVSNEAEAATALRQQLLGYSNARGLVSTDRASGYTFGPYLNKIPMNPRNGKRSIVADITTDDLSRLSTDGTDSGWRAYVLLGIVIANDGALVRDVDHVTDVDGTGSELPIPPG